MKKLLFAFLVTLILAGCGSVGVQNLFGLYTVELPDNVSTFKGDDGREYIEKISYSFESDVGIDRIPACLPKGAKLKQSGSQIKAYGEAGYAVKYDLWNLKYDLMMHKEQKIVKIMFYNLRQNTRNGNDIYIGTWTGSIAAEAYKKIDNLAHSIDGCLKN